MSLIAYNALKEYSNTGVELPTLHAGALAITTQQCNADALTALINTFAPTSGWAMYRDTVQLATHIENTQGLIEAQFNQGENSLHIMLTANNQYHISNFVGQKDTQNTNTLYKDLSVEIRESLQQAGHAVYRLWYEKNAESLWQAQAQQFLGFTQEHK